MTNSELIVKLLQIIQDPNYKHEETPYIKIGVDYYYLESIYIDDDGGLLFSNFEYTA